ncbi:MAG: hypothetical protein HUU29_12155 [Planctomycetaceae bacterium]|nr:hypothetical protein [Planctomycetaceae bacterium]
MDAKKQHTDRWRIWIDTGGTFTDCIALSPAGEARRVKVLSASVIRTTVARMVDARRLILDLLPAMRNEGLVGLNVALPGKQHEPFIIASFDDRSKTIELSAPLSAVIPPGTTVELISAEEAPILATRLITETPVGQSLPPIAMRLATTRGTNALLEHRGAPTVLLVTKGFGDLLEIGNQTRPDLFALNIVKPKPLSAMVIEVEERLDAQGRVIESLNVTKLRDDIASAKQSGMQAAAVALMHSYLNPAHERQTEELLKEAGFKYISSSAQLSPMIRHLPRAQTATVDAYVGQVIGDYLNNVARPIGENGTLHIMTSAGGLVRRDAYRAKDSLLSGPAGGVAGAAAAGRDAGFAKVIGFDMGGTSTDVARFDGRYELEYETEKAGVRVVAPMMSIETVAAGGGSICAFDGVKLVVGPDSAGANPGPACYGRGGPLAVTDINFYLGKIPPEFFPFPLDRPAVERRLSALIDEIAAATGKRYEPVELANGFLRVANANMVKAIRSISVAKGYNPRDYVLVAFGGAAGQHACAVARELGMERVLLHPDAGILSAYGIGMAEIARHGMAGVYRPYSEGAVAALGDTFAELAAPLAAEVECEGIARERIEARRALDLRYRGLDAYLTVREPSNTGSNNTWGGTGSASAAARIRSPFSRDRPTIIAHSSPPTTASSPPPTAPANRDRPIPPRAPRANSTPPAARRVARADKPPPAPRAAALRSSPRPPHAATTRSPRRRSADSRSAPQDRARSPRTPRPQTSPSARPDSARMPYESQRPDSAHSSAPS